MRLVKISALILLVVALSATVHAQKTTTTVKDAIANCAALRDYCSGFVTGALMLAPRTGELGLCDPNENNGGSLGTTDSMLADWMKNQVDKGYLSLRDDGYVAMTVGMRSLYPCKRGTR